jgi:hypothetical protein
MHPYLHQQVTIMIPQVAPRTGEQVGTVESHHERW